MPSDSNRAGWTRWMPGLLTLREYEPRWLRARHVAGLVLTTMLVPVGIAYAVASGVPGIYGLYATIIRSWPTRCSVRAASWCSDRTRRWPPSSSASSCRCRAATRARGRAGRHDGGRLGHRLHSGGRRAPRLRHRAALEAHPLRLHERHRADGPDQPAAEAFRLLDRERRAAAKPLGDRRGRARRKDELGRVRGRRGHARRDPRAQAQQAHAGHPDRGRRGDGGRRRVGSCATRADVSVLGPLPQGLPVLHDPVDRLRRHRAGADRRLAVAMVSFADTSVLSRVYAARTGTMSIPIRRWSGSAPPISPPGSSRASRSAAARRERRLPRPRARRRS